MRTLALVLVLASIGCRRSTEATADAAPAPIAPVQTVTATTTDPLAPPPREVPVAEPPQENVTFDTGTLTEPGKTVATAAEADPFDGAMASVRSSALGCFSSMPPGEYSASIAVNVTAAGTATRIEVVSGPSDGDVRKCLESAARRSYPASPDGRKLTIVVQVKG